MRIKLWKNTTPNGQEPYIDTFLRETDQPTGAVIVCPGGGYTHFGRYEGNPVAARFNELGFHAFVLEYRVKPTVFPEPQQDLLRAIRIVRSRAAEWKIAPDQIAVLGFSAGGHLAAGAGVFCDEVDSFAGDEADRFSARPDAVVLGYSVISVGREFGYYGGAVQLAGPEPSQEMIDKLSLENRVTPELPPTFLWHSAADDCVPVKNSVIFAEKLWAAGVKAELHVFPSGGHGLGLANDNDDLRAWPDLAARFLKSSCRFHSSGCR